MRIGREQVCMVTAWSRVAAIRQARCNRHPLPVAGGQDDRNDTNAASVQEQTIPHA